MRLRADKQGKPLIVLEAGDVAAINKVGVLLAGAAAHLGEPTRMDMLDLAANLQAVVSGELPGIGLPKKREAKAEASEPPAGPAEEPPFVPGDPTDNGPARRCQDCGEWLKPSEVRANLSVCRVCRPINETVPA